MRQASSPGDGGPAEQDSFLDDFLLTVLEQKDRLADEVHSLNCAFADAKAQLGMTELEKERLQAELRAVGRRSTTPAEDGGGGGAVGAGGAGGGGRAGPLGGGGAGVGGGGGRWRRWRPSVTRWRGSCGR